MKTINATCLALLASCLAAQSQLQLTSGEVWTYEFTTLPFVRTDPGFPSFAYCQYFTLGFTPLGAGNMFRYELFENSVAETPFASGTASVSPAFFQACIPAWQDRQGVVRVTMLSGSATLDRATFTLWEDRDLTSHDVFELSVVPVAEPGVLSLLSGGLLAGVVWRALNKNKDGAA